MGYFFSFYLSLAWLEELSSLRQQPVEAVCCLRQTHLFSKNTKIFGQVHPPPKELKNKYQAMAAMLGHSGHVTHVTRHSSGRPRRAPCTPGPSRGPSAGEGSTRRPPREISGAPLGAQRPSPPKHRRPKRERERDRSYVLLSSYSVV